VDVAIAAWEWAEYLGAAEDEGVDVCVFLVAARRAEHHSRDGQGRRQLPVEPAHRPRGQAPRIRRRHRPVADGTVSEGAGENLFIIKDGVLYTPGIAHSLLNGITRHTVMTLAKDWGSKCARCAMPREMLYLADELFFTGTATEVAAIRSVDGIQIGNGKRGPITRSCRPRTSRSCRASHRTSGAGSITST
jgi:branched-chain amino acid aminotransferase